jgi:hypothetical protein
VRKAKTAKTQLTKMLREAEVQCLLWEVEVKNGVAGASDQLSKWEAEYNQRMSRGWMAIRGETYPTDF